MADLVGTILKGQYFLRELAGRGGMADVYLAWDKLRSTQMAVKILRRDLASNERFKEALRRERDLLESLSHPNIVRLYEFEPDDATPFIVMAWVDGGNLRQRIEAAERPLTLDETSEILRPICAALQYAHQRGVFHCDIKPSNVMLHRNGQDVFLADFGIARLSTDKGGSGTPPYMAPEQFFRNATAQSDIYALGITVYEMLSGGVLPFRGDSSTNPGSTARARFEWEHNNLPLPPLSSFNPSLPQGVLDTVSQALEKDPRKRFPSTLALWETFERARGERAGSSSSGFTQTSAASPTEVAQRAHRPYLYARLGEKAGQYIQIPKKGLTIGRGTICDLRLLDRTVSRDHASLVVTKRGIYLRDNGSSVGTWLNDRRLGPNAPVILKEGDVIRIGQYQLFEVALQ